MGRSSRKAAFNKRYTFLLDLNALYRMNGCSIDNISVENLRRKHQIGKSLPKSIIADFAGRVVDNDLVNEYMATERRYYKELLETRKKTENQAAIPLLNDSEMLSVINYKLDKIIEFFGFKV